MLTSGGGLRPGSTATAHDFATASGAVLQHLRVTVGLDLWAVGRRQGDDWVVLVSEGDLPEGMRVPWQDTLCARVHEGRASWCTPDVDAVPALVEARELVGLPISAFVTVPLEGPDGEVLGTLCGVGTSGAADPDLRRHADELRVLAGVLGTLLSVELRLEREARHRELAEADAQTDPLTGLGNRRQWDRQLTAEEERCRRYGSTAAVVTVDVDGLKVVNDRWGHDAGDAVLRQVASVLRRESRPEDVVARLGGDEFAVLLAETSAEQADAVADRLRRALAGADLAASLGVAVRGREGLVAAWREADARMYDSKRRLPRREPVAPGGRPVEGPLDGDALVTELLGLARQHLGADIAFVGRFEGPLRVMRALQSVRPLPVGPGHTEGLDTTYCQRIVRGELPRAIPDTSLNLLAQSIEATHALPIGAYLGVPITLADGELYGTLCCLNHTPNPRFDADAVAFLESLAASLTRVLGEEEQERAGRRALLASLDGLLGTQALTMRYQPVVDLSTGVVRAAEALARFRDRSRTTAQWFSDAGQVDRGAELELRAVRLALADTRDWERDVWLNLSASVLASPAVDGLFAGRDLRHLVVEVSEHEEVSDYAALRSALAPWRAAGLRVAVDDVGSGFASLRHVLELEPDVVKLDISLVRGVPVDPARRALVTAMVSFADQAGALVVAEGIETDAELQALRGSGVVLGQGFHLSVPVAPDRLPDRVAVTAEVPSPRPGGRVVSRR